MIRKSQRHSMRPRTAADRPGAERPVLFVLAAALLFPGPLAAGPRIVLEERSVLFGTVAPGEVSWRELTVENAGDTPLRLGPVRARSDAARAAVPDTVRPGGSAPLVVAILPSAAGPFEAKILVETNDPAEPLVAIVLRAEVAPRCDVDREPRWLGLLRPGERSNATILLRCRPDAGVRLVAAAATPDFVTPAPRAGTDSLETVIALSVAAGAPRGPFGGHVMLVLAGERADTLRVPVGGEVVGRWRVIPVRLRAALTKRSGPSPPVVLCERMVREGARVVRATTDMPGHVVRVEETKAGRAYRVVLLPASGWKAGEFSGTIRIETDDPKERLIEVPAALIVGAERGR